MTLDLAGYINLAEAFSKNSNARSELQFRRDHFEFKNKSIYNAVTRIKGLLETFSEVASYEAASYEISNFRPMRTAQRLRNALEDIAMVQEAVETTKFKSKQISLNSIKSCKLPNAIQALLRESETSTEPVRSTPEQHAPRFVASAQAVPA